MAKKVDSNQSLIVKNLRKMGCGVQSLADIGKGCPDILCGWRGKNFAFEVKDPLKPVSRRRLTPDEQQWHTFWPGQVAVIHSAEEAMKIMLELTTRE